MPEAVKHLVGVPAASYLRPLLYGLKRDPADIELLVDLPAQLAVKLQKRTDYLRCAFLSPIDYARHGGDYCIVPGIGVSSSRRSDTIQLFINSSVRNIDAMAVDIRVTSEIILAKIILGEKFPNLTSDKKTLQVVPMMPDIGEMLRKADAALVVNFHPSHDTGSEFFAIDLVEEWFDMTGLPYVHGIWVGYDDAGVEPTAERLIKAKHQGVTRLNEIIPALATDQNIPPQVSAHYLSNFSYELGEEERNCLTEFMKYAYFYGVLPDVPDLNFFDLDVSPPPVN